MSDNKIIFIGSLSLKKKNYGGITVKNNYFLRALRDNSVSLTVLDTYDWGKRPMLWIRILYQLGFNRQHKTIILSSGSRASLILLKLFRITSSFNKKELFYFASGGGIIDLINKQGIAPYLLPIKIYVETRSLENFLITNGLTQTRHIPNWKSIPKEQLEIPPFDPSKKFGFFSFSRITEEKGTSLIVNAIDVLYKNGYNIELSIYGIVDSAYSETFYSLINEKPYIRHKGTIDLFEEDNYLLLSNYDLMLFPTFHEGEGFPGTVIDCYIAGVPVLASDWKYNSEFIIDGYTGLLCEAKNANSLIEKMKYALDNRKTIYEMRQNCILESRKYNIDKIVKDFIKNEQLLK